MSDGQPDRDPFEVLAEQFAAQLRSGASVSVADYARQHPDHAEEIHELFPVIRMLENSKKRVPPLADELSRTSFDDFEIVREIARGGMGVVYEAHQKSLDRRVALKVLPANHLPSRVHVARFEREAQSAARLHHGHIVPVYGVGEQDGTHYYVMQYIDGCGLDMVLQELQQTDVVEYPNAWGDRIAWARSVAVLLTTTKLESPLQSRWPSSLPNAAAADLQLATGSNGSTERRRIFGLISALRRKARLRGTNYWKNIAHIGFEVARVLEYAHANGVVHRDIKPSNLLIDVNANIWVTDFGLAKITGKETLTGSRETLGTLRYMAPEQFNGTADHRSDIYSLGLTLYELATLHPAFGESNRGRLLGHLLPDCPRPPRSLNRSIPRDLESIILKAIAHNPKRRYQTAGELVEDFGRLLRGATIARKSSPVDVFWHWCQRHGTAVRIASAAAVVLLTFALVLSRSYVRTTEALSVAVEKEHDARRAWAEVEQVKTQAHYELTRERQRVEVLERTLQDMKALLPPDKLVSAEATPQSTPSQ